MGMCLFRWNFQASSSRNLKKNPIYLFYDIVINGPNNTPGDDGDVHYRCLHGAHKVCTIKRSMKNNLSGAHSVFYYYSYLTVLFSALVNNLRVHVKPMHLLYYILKDHEEPPTLDEIVIAAGKKQLDGSTEAEYKKKLEKTSTKDIKKAFEHQKAQATVSDYMFSTSTLPIAH
jgi:hypothetical protein